MTRHPIVSRIGAALKAAQLAFSGGGRPVMRSWTTGLLPGASFDYEAAAGNPTENSAVSICLGWIGDNFPEARMVIERSGAAGPSELRYEHPLLSLVSNPNPSYDGDALLAATAMSYAAFGNAYWYKARNVAGRVTELWYVPHWQVVPAWPADGSEFISHYEYRVNGRVFTWRREDVIHFRFGFDARNSRLGQSRLWPVLREIVTDNEAATMMAALLRNMGMLGVLITPSSPSIELQDGDAEAIKKTYRVRHTGEAAGEVMVNAAALKVERLGLSPEQMVLDKIRRIPESRIAAALRLPAMTVGLSVGDEQRTFSNYAQARRAAYEDCLGPMQRRFARQLSKDLLPELGGRSNERVGWDYTQVIALQDDRMEVYRQTVMAVRGGLMKVNEGRQRIGLAPDPGQDVYLRGLQGGAPAMTVDSGVSGDAAQAGGSETR